MRTLAFLLVLCPFLPGCKTAGGQAWTTCELGKLPSASEPVIADVTQIVTSGGANWQGQLESLGAALAPGQLDCLMEALAAAWAATRGEPTAERRAALERLQLYLNAHRAHKACGERRSG